MENFGIEKSKIKQKYNEDDIIGIIDEKLGTKLKHEIPADAFGKGKNAYKLGLTDSVIVWSKDHNQYLRIRRDNEEKNA